MDVHTAGISALLLSGGAPNSLSGAERRCTDGSSSCGLLSCGPLSTGAAPVVMGAGGMNSGASTRPTEALALVGAGGRAGKL